MQFKLVYLIYFSGKVLLPHIMYILLDVSILSTMHRFLMFNNGAVKEILIYREASLISCILFNFLKSPSILHSL